MLFDTHCHLDVTAFDADREDVIVRASAAQVTRFINPAYDMISSQRAVALARARASVVYAAVGVHPNDLASLDGDGLHTLSELATCPEVVAIGEIGLDYHWNTYPAETQKASFARQLELAHERQLPIIVHCRDAYDDTLEILERRMPAGVLLHAFAGTLEHAGRALQRGYTLGIGGPVTYKNAGVLRDIVRTMPMDQMVLETDAPYLAPHPYRGKRNEPVYMALTAERVAELRDIPVEEVARVTTANAERFFRLT